MKQIKYAVLIVLIYSVSCSSKKEVNKNKPKAVEILITDCNLKRDGSYYFMKNPETGDYIIRMKGAKDESYFGSIFTRYPLGGFYDTTNKVILPFAIRFKDTCIAKAVYTKWFQEDQRQRQEWEKARRKKDSIDSLRQVFIPLSS